MNQPDENDDLWRLLDKASSPVPSPYFSRNVLREVRGMQQEKAGVIGWMWRRWYIAAGGAAAALVLGLVAFERSASQPDQLTAIAAEVSESPDYLVITNLDELLATEESSVWLEKPVY